MKILHGFRTQVHNFSFEEQFLVAALWTFLGGNFQNRKNNRYITHSVQVYKTSRDVFWFSDISNNYETTRLQLDSFWIHQNWGGIFQNYSMIYYNKAARHLGRKSCSK